jgi:hypothetical protein
MNTEEQEFDGWMHEEQAAHGYAPIKLRKLIKLVVGSCVGLIAIVATSQYLGVPSSPRYLAAIFIGGIASTMMLTLPYKRAATNAPPCSGCGRPMTLNETLPTQADCDKHGYIMGESKHVYAVNNSNDGTIVTEIKKRWYVCASCKKYFLLDSSVTSIIGSSKAAIAEREGDYLRNLSAQSMLKGKRLKFSGEPGGGGYGSPATGSPSPHR